MSAAIPEFTDADPSDNGRKTRDDLRDCAAMLLGVRSDHERRSVGTSSGATRPTSPATTAAPRRSCEARQGPEAARVNVPLVPAPARAACGGTGIAR